MKLKSNQTRTYDGDGYKKRAACLCFRSESEEEVRRWARRGRGRGRLAATARGARPPGGVCAGNGLGRPAPRERSSDGIPEAGKRGTQKGWRGGEEAAVSGAGVDAPARGDARLLLGRWGRPLSHRGAPAGSRQRPGGPVPGPDPQL